MEESKLNIGCIRFLKMNKDSMSFAHSNESRGVARLASRALEIESARCLSFRGVRNLTERKEFDPKFFRGLAAPIVDIFESTWAGFVIWCYLRSWHQFQNIRISSDWVLQRGHAHMNVFHIFLASVENVAQFALLRMVQIVRSNWHAQREAMQSTNEFTD